MAGLCSISLTACQSDNVLEKYTDGYNTSVSQLELFAKKLPIPLEGIELEKFELSQDINATALIDVSNNKIIQSTNLMEKISPASTTKVMTAYVALKHGNLDDIVTVSSTAVKLPSDSQMCGLQEGDTISLRDLIYGLTVYSGNDAAIAIAEHISGSHTNFIQLMNDEANMLGATSTNFSNAHGLDETDHLTTVYDLFLMFEAATRNELYVEMLNTTRYTTTIKDSSGAERQIEWTPTNYYHSGRVKAPEGINVIGGKTGTTSKAKNCLILLVKDQFENSYISLTMGSSTKDGLYENLNQMLSAIPSPDEEMIEEDILE